MKLWSSFKKELLIASRGFYFYIEIITALLILLIMLLAVPDDFSDKSEEYLYLGFPSAAFEAEYTKNFDDLDGLPTSAILKSGKDEISARLFETSDKEIYVLDSEDIMVRLAQEKHKIGAAVIMDADDFEMHYTYYLQGNESGRLKALLRILHGQDDMILYDAAETQPVTSLTDIYTQLSDRENLLPVLLTFNGSLMGFFIIAAYIFLDKKEGIIKAYAVTPSTMWIYLMSKVMVLTLTMLITSLLIISPLMGAQINYILVCLFLITTGLFSSGMGVVLASYYDDMVKSFGAMFLLMIALMLPALAYFTPGWDPQWLKFIPSYYIVFGFKEIFIKGDMGFVLTIALAYLVTSCLLFLWADTRYRRTLSV